MAASVWGWGAGSIWAGASTASHRGRQLARGQQGLPGTEVLGTQEHRGRPLAALAPGGHGVARSGGDGGRSFSEWLGCPEPSRLLQACMRGWKAGAVDADCRLLPAKPSTPRVPTTPRCPRGKATWFTDVSEPTVPGVRGWQQAHRTEECGRRPTAADAGGPAAPGLPRGAVQSPLTAGRVLAGGARVHSEVNSSCLQNGG